MRKENLQKELILTLLEPKAVETEELLLTLLEPKIDEVVKNVKAKDKSKEN